ncbi:MAG TPA: LysR family transcriptional regulator [Hyphomicrobiaceae bacterium]|nr:LysR family transcriptional regulator [Hyphomicrobiaceae bacterium]
MPRDIDTALLRAFLAVVETGSVTSAARLLNLTQAAVSQQIKRLEELFGSPLFERAHKRLVLAPAGERLILNAERLVALNDETWGLMTTPHFEGEVRLGVPCDIVASYMPPILKRFNAVWPRVRVSLSCGESVNLLAELAAGKIDLTFTTETGCGAEGETLHTDRLVWVGLPGGDAHTRDPLPISVGGPTCMFRPAVLEALRRCGRDWRIVCEISNMEAIFATISAGLAIAPMLRATVPAQFIALGTASGLPQLPEFRINLYAPKTTTNDIARELASHIRHEFRARFGGEDGAGTRVSAPLAPMAAGGGRQNGQVRTGA